MDLGPGTSDIRLGGAAIATGFRGRGPRPDNRRIPVARINERIRVPQVRVIGDEGEQLGVMDIRDAIRTAREKGLDLVEVAATADPPVCRIIDFGKFQYEAKKKANEAKKKQSVIVVKEVKFRPGTDDHDYDYRMKHAREWLQEGDKVKATIWFRGREMTHRELGARILEKLEGDLQDIGEVEARPRMEGNQMFIIFGPRRHKGSAKPDRPASAPGERAAERPRERPAERPAELAVETATEGGGPAVE
ncbi:MAG TPA: translation initiation factor IF-3 [Pyrinomonadaceae bacterium]|nr:translation initiation factor IF-3 [Pyrinomonadaceae bacterium]